MPLNSCAMKSNDEHYTPFEMPVIDLDGVRLALCRIEPDHERGTRRRRERQAVQRLLEYFGFSESAYRHSASGEPYIDDSELHISVSHSLGYAAMAVSLQPGIGVDIEQLRPAQLQHVAPRFLSEREQAEYSTPDRLLWAWAAKEAIYKAAAIPGLSGPEMELESAFCRVARVDDEYFRLSTLYSVEYCCVVALFQPRTLNQTVCLSHTELAENTEILDRNENLPSIEY